MEADGDKEYLWFQEYMRKTFIEILKAHGLWDEFIKDYGEDYEAKNWHSDGWCFEHNKIQLRECKLFPNHSDNVRWYFGLTELDSLINMALCSNGWETTHNGGDEEDGLVIFEKSKLSKE